VLRLNRQQQFICADVTVTVESTTSAFAGGWTAGEGS
jgi:phosphoribosylformylglycinamidine (FGAM) synthase-like amidotransferase family enzyme